MHLLWRLKNAPRVIQPEQYVPAPVPVYNPPVYNPPPTEIPVAPSASTTLFPINAPTVCAADLDTVLRGKLAGKGSLFLAAANRWKIDPVLMVAISAHETGRGTSEKVQKLNNPGGLMEGGKVFLKFETLEAGIEHMAERLRKRYYDCGLTTAKTIQPKYCPVGASNDPTGLNSHWLTGVEKFYKEILANRLPQYAKI